MGAIRDAHTQEFGFLNGRTQYPGWTPPGPGAAAGQALRATARGPRAPRRLPPAAPRPPRRRRAGSRAPPAPGGQEEGRGAGSSGAARRRPGSRWEEERRWGRQRPGKLAPHCLPAAGSRARGRVTLPQVRGRCAARLHLTFVAFCKLINTDVTC